jgi:hypothetical protein
MTTQEIATRLVEFCKTEQFAKAQRELYAPNAVSIEPFAVEGYEKETKGLDAMMAKNKKFESEVEQSFGVTVSNPLVTKNSIAFIFSMDIKMKGKERDTMTELCVYEVKDGKIVSEQFFM